MFPQPLPREAGTSILFLTTYLMPKAKKKSTAKREAPMKEANSSTVEVKVLSRVKMNGEVYEAGQEVELPDNEQVQSLIDGGQFEEL